MPGTADVEDCDPLDAEYQCTIYFYDEDQDGFGKCAVKQCLCEPEGAYTVTACEVARGRRAARHDCPFDQGGVGRRQAKLRTVGVCG